MCKYIGHHVLLFLTIERRIFFVNLRRYYRTDYFTL